MRHPQPRHALVVGLGTGSTAGWLGAIPSMERVDAIELEPLVIEVARASQSVNHDVLNNPKVRVTIGDAREWLLTSRDRYDVIASEPSNPFRAGVASLFTVEYYRAAASRLSDDGVFAQWVQGYEIDARTLRTIYTTMAAVFPQVETWQTTSADLVLLATVRPRPYSTAALRARIAEEPFKSALAHTWRAVDINGVLAHYLAGDAVSRALAGTRGAAVNTDDRNVVEFGLARSVGRAGSVLVSEIRQLAKALGASRPPLDTEEGVAWGVTETAWANFVQWDAQTGTVRAEAPAERLRQEALRHYHLGGDLAGARDKWSRVTEPPRDPSELAMAAELEAEAGSETALPLIEQLRAFEPAEADIMLATLRSRQSRVEDAVAALESAFTRMRVDPWPDPRYKTKALALAATLAAHDQAAARRLYEALRQPFSLRAAEVQRLLASVEIAKHFDFRSACQAPVGALEPRVPWTSAFLLTRRDCYQANGDPRLANADRDIEAFFAHEPLPLSVR
jgi:spermidine synthase